MVSLHLCLCKYWFLVIFFCPYKKIYNCYLSKHFEQTHRVHRLIHYLVCISLSYSFFFITSFYTSFSFPILLITLLFYSSPYLYHVFFIFFFILPLPYLVNNFTFLLLTLSLSSSGFFTSCPYPILMRLGLVTSTCDVMTVFFSSSSRLNSGQYLLHMSCMSAIVRSGSMSATSSEGLDSQYSGFSRSSSTSVTTYTARLLYR